MALPGATPAAPPVPVRRDRHHRGERCPTEPDGAVSVRSSTHAGTVRFTDAKTGKSVTGEMGAAPPRGTAPHLSYADTYQVAADAVGQRRQARAPDRHGEHAEAALQAYPSFIPAPVRTASASGSRWWSSSTTGDRQGAADGRCR